MSTSSSGVKRPVFSRREETEVELKRTRFPGAPSPTTVTEGLTADMSLVAKKLHFNRDDSGAWRLSDSGMPYSPDTGARVFTIAESANQIQMKVDEATGMPYLAFPLNKELVAPLKQLLSSELIIKETDIGAHILPQNLGPGVISLPTQEGARNMIRALALLRVSAGNGMQ